MSEVFNIVFGYIRPAGKRLSEEDQKLFGSAYCGLCRTLGKRYGFTARFLLNYDFTFLAILLSIGTEPACSKHFCPVHPCRGCTSVDNDPSFELAADCSVVLAWWQFQDHIQDGPFFKGLLFRLASLLIYRSYTKARKHAHEFDLRVRQRLKELSDRERECCDSLDAAADPFALLMAEIAIFTADEVKRRIYYQLFYHLGRWIYLVDAADDYRKDLKSGNYNPIRYRFRITCDQLPDSVRAAIGDTLDASIRKMSAAYALLNPGIWKAVLDSIFYESLYGIGKAVLNGEYPNRPRLTQKRKTEGKTHDGSL